MVRGSTELYVGASGHSETPVDAEAEQRALLGWMRSARVPGTEYRTKPAAINQGDQGGLSEVVEFLYVHGGAEAAGALAAGLWGFLQSRRAKVQITLRRGGTVTVVTSTMPRAEVQSLIEGAFADEDHRHPAREPSATET